MVKSRDDRVGLEGGGTRAADPRESLHLASRRRGQFEAATAEAAGLVDAPIRAAGRETSRRGADTLDAAFVTKPIEITLPSPRR